MDYGDFAKVHQELDEMGEDEMAAEAVENMAPNNMEDPRAQLENDSDEEESADEGQ